jgi:hypothetical protein
MEALITDMFIQSIQEIDHTTDQTITQMKILRKYWQLQRGPTLINAIENFRNPTTQVGGAGWKQLELRLHLMEAHLDIQLTCHNATRKLGRPKKTITNTIFDKLFLFFLKLNYLIFI